MNGPRGSLVIALLFFIGGQLAFIASALSGARGSVLGAVMVLFSAVAVIRVFVELFREGAGKRHASTKQERERKASRQEQLKGGALERARKRAAEREGPAISDPVTPTAMLDPDAGVSQLDPEKRRPPHQD